MNQFDFVIVGSGINSLVCAALLSKAGHRVCVLERNEQLGGCIRTEELTLPGFKHEVFSAVHSLVVSSPWYAELAEDLYRHGVEYCNNEYPTAVVLQDGRSLILKTDRAENVRAIERLSPGDGGQYQHFMEQLDGNAAMVFGLIGGDLWSFSTLKLMAVETLKRGLRGMLAFAGEAMQTSRDWLRTHFRSDLSQALLSPWILHAGQGPESAFSGLINQVMIYTLEQTGCPMIKGGNQKLVDSLVKIIEGQGGVCFADTHVARIHVEENVARGVVTAEGAEFSADKAVICNVTPTQLYHNLLRDAVIPREVRSQAKQYRYGRGMMLIHIAMEEEPQWTEPRLRDVVMLHVTSGLDGVSKAVNEADRGMLPEEATIVVCQPVAIDPTRAPEGKWILWLQLQEVPRCIKGDTKNEIAVPADGHWHEEVKERYADRIVDQLCGSIANLRGAIAARKVYGPDDWERMNINLCGGDAYSGTCSVDQNLFWRPLRSVKNHSTPVKRLYHIGASTHPGPGLGGGSGYIVARKLA